MSKLCFEVLDQKRAVIFKDLAQFSQIGVLAGGTALALQLEHRYSYDFDVFCASPIPPKLIFLVQKAFGKKIKKIIDSGEELSFFTVNRVKVSFVYFPFLSLHSLVASGSIPLFHLQDLASNKAYVIGRRGEYRDYVDLFFLLKRGLRLKKIIKEAEKRFGGAFSERLFLEQLCYFSDLKDFRIDFLKKKYSPEQIFQFFKAIVREYR